MTSVSLGSRSASRVRGRGCRVVIAGGGVAALETMLALHRLAPGLVDVELVAPEHHFWYRPLAAAEPFGAGRAHSFELTALASAVGARFTPGELARVDSVERRVMLKTGAEIAYDALVVACGARPGSALPGAITFRGPADVEPFQRLLGDVARGTVERLAFVVPGGVVWPLPLYELALQTATMGERVGRRAPDLAVVTHEHAPLEIFGAAASKRVAELLDEHRIHVFTGLYAVRFEGGRLSAVPKGSVPADRVVALPHLEGCEIDGLPRDRDGFVSVDEHGRVLGLDDVYAAGDVTTFPVKQGGLATQQADAVAEAVAATAGADLDPQPFHPVLRGLLLTGSTPEYLRAALDGGHGETSAVSDEALWWPRGKIAGRYLGPFLASLVSEPDVEVATSSALGGPRPAAA